MKPFLKVNILKCVYALSFVHLVCFNVLAGNEPISSGSFVINMGITPQTVNNGLRPYGMVYDLVQNFKVPIKWVINSSKVKDGVDFTHNGIDYKGGPFVILAEFRTAAVNARIAYWVSQGVIGAETVAPITVDVSMTIRAMPIWTLDSQNGSIAQAYINTALIPSTAYNLVAPSALTCCMDLFVMPHADPTWAIHSRLFTWNLDCDGAIWLACHAGSAFSNLFNPSNKSQQMNFLSQKTGNAIGTGTYEENSLILWGNHADGSPPYNYSFPSDPIMQFMGILDGASQNGSEQIYLPKVGWNSGAKVYINDPSQSNVPLLSPGPAAIMVSGRGFDNPLRGRVMLEAGHAHNKSTAPENIAAQRAFLNFSFLTVSEKAIVPIINLGETSLASNSVNTLSFDLPLGVSASNYTITWTSSCGGTFSSTNTQTTNFTAPSFAVATPCVVSVTIKDACGRESSDSKAVLIGGCTLIVTPTASNTTCSGGATNGSINMAIANGSAPYSWIWTRENPSGTGSGTGTLISNLIAGTYNVQLTSSGVGACTKNFQSIINNSPAVTVSAIGTNPVCFGVASGSIVLNTLGGTPPFNYNWGAGISVQNRSSLLAGLYSVTLTDSKGCTATASSLLTQPADILITSSLIQVACFGSNTGAISLSTTGGFGTKNYAWSNGATTQNIGSLVAGTYNLTVSDANGCTKTGTYTVTEPVLGITLSSTSSNYACFSAKGSIDLTIDGGTSPYTYLWSNGAITQDLLDLNPGNYTVTVTDSKGCTAVLSKLILQIPALSLSTSIINTSCPTPGNGSINLTVTGGSSPYRYVWADGPSTEDRTSLVAGFFTVTVTDANGCASSTSATLTSINNLPNPPIGINR